MKKTVLYDAHVKLGAKMIEYAGFMMPISYQGITEEHMAVRDNAGVFDVSHMGEIHIKGEEAETFVDYLFTNDVKSMHEKQVLYGMMCYPDGGVVDDLLVYKYNKQHYLLVVNASNIDKDVAWIHEHNTFDATVSDQSEATSEIALQGPKAHTMLQKATEYDLTQLTFFTFDDMMVYGRRCMVSRTGYTGEDGFEIYGNHDDILHIFKQLFQDFEALTPCGLGCRDTLRFEVALPLYGHELSKTITPIEAGYHFAVSFDKANYIGKEILKKQKMEKPTRRIVGLELLSKGILREGYGVYDQEKEVGMITTGYRVPGSNLNVAMALIDKPYDKIGTELKVAIRNKMVDVKVRNKKFKDKNYSK